MSSRFARSVAMMLLLLPGRPATPAENEPIAPVPDIFLFVQLAATDRELSKAAERTLASDWRDGYAPILIDLVRLLRPSGRVRAGGGVELDNLEGGGGPGAGAFDGEGAGRLTPMSDGGGGGPAEGSDPASRTRRRLIRFLEKQTGQRFGEDLDAWRQWMWKQPYAPHPDYAAFKGGLYGNIDPRMREFFPGDVKTTIRLDQVDWGGVRVNGIPPLDHPAVTRAADAAYLKDRHVVFGMVVGGEARAYPKRILAWHEMALDRLGGRELTIVYCTLCGTVIPYESHAGERRFTFGTSGFLYRSNKLMFDAETRSLWSSVYGKPVIGPLAGTDLELTRHAVVTTSWGEWRAAHPQTTVLALETGYDRDYKEGAAYRDYFRHDRLMFAVDREDDRLDRKAEVLAMRGNPPLAISVRKLASRRLLVAEHDGRTVLVATSAGGASRVYEIADERFSAWSDDETLLDDKGRSWRVTEAALVASDDPSERRPRVAAHRSFWFAWYAHYPETRLIR